MVSHQPLYHKLIPTPPSRQRIGGPFAVLREIRLFNKHASDASCQCEGYLFYIDMRIYAIACIQPAAGQQSASVATKARACRASPRENRDFYQLLA
jgi:hypothetical protein